jgi:tRNA pseudouridine32 synthase / 23S rRNA pseudouridine746 synthase
MIVSQGDGWLCVAKPPGIGVIPGRDEEPEACLKAKLEALTGMRMWVVHRVDRDTSGAVLFATNAETHRALSIAFEERRVHKRYLAFVKGTPSPASGVIDVALHTGRKNKMRPARHDEEDTLLSRTRYATETTFADGISLVSCAPETGRQHQIRVHMRAIACPLLVDPLYGDDCHPLIKRLTLHAASIEVPDLSVSGSVPLWPDLQALKDALSALALNR